MDTSTLGRLRDWEGGADALAELAEGLGGGQGDGPGITVRLIRDYAQRGILDRPSRDGKAAVYGWRHLVQMLAARALLADGWPLAKIAEAFAVSSEEEILAFVPGPSNAGVPRPPHGARPEGGPPPPDRAPPPTAEDPALRALREIRQARAMAGETAPGAAGGPAARPRSRRLTRIEVAPGVELNIETRRLRRLGRAEAEAIGRAVAACLTDPGVRREDD